MADDKTFLALKKDFDNLSTAVNSAKTTADSALSKANTAQSTADSANSTATLANNAANAAETNSQWRYNDAINKINAKVDNTNAVISNSICVGENATVDFSSHSRVALGARNNVSGQFSAAIGSSNTVAGSFACAAGFKLSIPYYGFYQTVVGNNNKEIEDSYSTTFIVGRGAANRANSLRADMNNVYGLPYHSSGADYAEYFEWHDGNKLKQDRIGLFVTLDGEKIKIANSKDNFILGAISGCPSIVGNSYEDQWNKMFLTDIYGRPIQEVMEIPEEVDNEGNVIAESYKKLTNKVSLDYNENQKYLGRSKRPEWDAIGMLGKLVMRDDGTSQVNKYVWSNDEGKATYSEKETKFRCIARLDESHIKVLIL